MDLFCLDHFFAEVSKDVFRPDLDYRRPRNFHNYSRNAFRQCHGTQSGEFCPALSDWSNILGLFGVNCERCAAPIFAIPFVIVAGRREPHGSRHADDL